MSIVMRLTWKRLAVIAITAATVRAQSIRVQPADPVDFPGVVDSNSPAYWDGGTRYVYNSLDLPVRSEAADPTHYSRARAVFVQGANRWRWIESVWIDTDGTVYGWYHAEPLNVCPGKPLTAPTIGALVSTDGVHFQDLGIVLRSGARNDCNTQTAYFAGGHGDFSVIPDRNGQYLYFLFTNYGGPVETQGVAIARMSLADRANPSGHVYKFFEGDWQEAGLGGRMTPIFPAKAAWNSDTPDCFWGPAVHWNTALQQYVVLMNHATDQSWGQEGIYASFNPDIANPAAWTSPQKIIDGIAWYPQVLGYDAGETDTLAGAKARLFIMGHSEWDLVFDPGSNTVQGSTASHSRVQSSLKRHSASTVR